MIRKLLSALCVLAAVATVSASAQTQQLTAEMFARDENFSSSSLSPDGASVVLIQRVAGNNQAIVVVDWRTRQAQAVQSARRDRGLFLDWVIWKGDARLLFAVTQRIDWDGTPDDVNYRQIQRVYSMNRDGTNVQAMFEGQMRQLLNPDFAPIELIDSLENDPDNVIIGTWGQNGYTAFRVNVTNGRATVIDDALGWDTSTVYVDGLGTPVLRTDPLANGAGYKFFRRAPQGGRWELAYEVRRASVAQNRDFFPISAGPGAGQIYIAARPEGQEYQAVYLYDTATGNLGAPVYAHANADAQGIQVDPTDNTLLAGCAETERWECRAVDPRMQRHFDAISVYFEGAADFSLLSVSHDKTKWLIQVNGPTIPPTVYVYDLSVASLTPVASTYPQLPRTQLAPTQVVHYTSRDGSALWGYLTTPRNTAGPVPLVVLPHGGPESRDSYAFGYFEQYLASLGYAVFQPNFRGSEGFGRSFANAGRRQWGLRMQDDITDGVRHLIAQGAVDAGRICIVGASYGGYAALAGGAFTPDLYRCVVSIAGDADLIEMLDQERRGQGRNSLGYAYWVAVTGDANADREALIATSPARHAENFTAPVLLIHGRDDYTVRVEQSEAMRDALRRAGKQVEYLDFEHEGHYWSNWEPENRQRMLETVGQFLSQNNGPR
ncbi:MAG: alpha/beta fold hydrolase [Alphaproteobacteria bacterium]|nr:alpha/beta fold hydrolase [Alphaproteobacteria bacterium]